MAVRLVPPEQGRPTSCPSSAPRRRACRLSGGVVAVRADLHPAPAGDQRLGRGRRGPESQSTLSGTPSGVGLNAAGGPPSQSAAAPPLKAARSTSVTIGAALIGVLLVGAGIGFATRGGLTTPQAAAEPSARASDPAPAASAAPPAPSASSIAAAAPSADESAAPAVPASASAAPVASASAAPRGTFL